MREKWALAPMWLKVWCIVTVPLTPLALAATFLAQYDGFVPGWVGIVGAAVSLTPWGVLSQAPWNGSPSWTPATATPPLIRSAA